MVRPHPNVVLGGVMVAFSALLFLWLIPSYVISPGAVRTLVLSPLLWPGIVAGLIGAGGALLLLLHRLRPAPRPEGLPGANAAGEVRIAALAVLMAVFYLLIEPLGMVFASMLAYAAFVLVTRAAILSRGVAILAGLLAIALPLALHAFFGHVAGVPVPQAPFLRLP